MSNLLPMTGAGTATQLAVNTATASSAVACVTGASAAATLTALMLTSTNAATSATVLRLVLADALQTVNVAGTGSAVQVLTALLEASIFVNVDEVLSGAPGECWAVNWETSAASQYEGFDFNSFATLGGQPFGMRSDGLYLLDGDNDAGEPIRASFSLGERSMGIAGLKRMEQVYAGMSSTGRMYLKVRYQNETGQQEFIYAARRDDDYHRMQRFDVGRGIKAHFLTFDIYNSDGCDFDLETVEFVVANMSRRI